MYQLLSKTARFFFQICISLFLAQSGAWAQPTRSVIPSPASDLFATSPSNQLNEASRTQTTRSLLQSTSVVTKRSAADPLPAEQAFVLTAKTHDGKISIQFAIAENYYLYKEKISIKPVQPLMLEPIQLPAGAVKYDETFAKDVEIYRTLLTIYPVKTLVNSSAPLSLDVYFQGCADIGICYPPQLQRLSFSEDSKTASVSVLDPVPYLPTSTVSKPSVATDSAFISQSSSNISKSLLSGNVLFLIIGFIGFGLLLSFTPCVLPMMPIVSAIVLRQNDVNDNPERKASTHTFAGFKLSFAYVLGMCFTYTVIGVLAGLAGAGLNGFLQHPVLLIVFSILMVALAGAQFGWYDLSLPEAWINKLNQQQNKAIHVRYAGVAMMGALSAVMVGPCVTAPLAGALSYIAQTGDAWTGGVALLSLSFGMGIPLLLIGVGGARYLPKTGAWMNQVTNAFGIMLLCVAIWTVQSLLAPWIATSLWIFILLLVAEMFGVFSPLTVSNSRLSKLAQLFGVLCVIWAAAIVWGMAGGRFDVLQPLAQSQATSTNPNQKIPQFKTILAQDLESTLLAFRGKPVMLDVYADWCVSCIEFERFTFNHEKVIPLLEQFILIKVDTTRNTVNDQVFLKKLKLFGPPAIIFYSPNGQENEAARVVSFQSAEPFSQHLKQLLAVNR